MEYLFRPYSYASGIGYPLFIFYLVAMAGLVLLIIRPYWAFLFAVLCLAARNWHAAVFTRTPFLGPYLNLNDLLLWIAIFAMLIETLTKKRQMWIPSILLAIFGVVIIGDFQSLYKYGFAENILRRIWSTALFPIMFLVSTNMVYSTRRAKSLYFALFLGVVIAALQHIVYIYIQAYTYSFQFRTISYLLNGGYAVLVGTILGQPNRELGRLKTVLCYTGLTLIAMSYILSFTRTFWVSIGLGTIFLTLFVRRQVFHFLVSIRFWLILGGAILIYSILFTGLELDKILAERFQYLTGYQKFLEAYEDRWRGAKAEIDIWLSGSLIFGTGASLPLRLDFIGARAAETGLALGHVGYTTYLAHYGLLGFIIYAILLPILTLKVGRRYYLEHAMDYGGRLVLVGLACVVIDAIGFVASNHYLYAWTHIQGVLYGVVWGLQREKWLKRRSG